MKVQKKKCFALFLAIVLVATTIGLSIGDVVASNTKTVLFTVPIGNGTDDLKIVKSAYTATWGYKGPQSFLFLDNGDVAILDADNNRIAIYDIKGAYISDMILECGQNDIPVLMANNGTEFCVIVKKEDVTKLRETDGYYALFLSNEISTKIDLDYDITAGDNIIVNVFYNNDGSVTAMTNRSDYINITPNGAKILIENQYDLSGNNKIFTLQNGRSVSFQVDDSVYEMKFVKQKSNENIIVTQLQRTKDGRYAFLVVEYSPNGKIVAYNIIEDWNNNFAVPHAQVAIDKNENLYYMEVAEQSVNIYKLSMHNARDTISQIDLDRLLTKDNYNNANRSTLEVSHISINRLTVYNRARAMANLTWTVRAQHKNGESDYVTIPNYVKNAQVGDVLTGIPYCWGGYNGYENVTYTSSSGSLKTAYSFANLVAGTSSVTAGNVCTDGGGNQPGTIGLDCSGYVTSAYSLGTNKKDAEFFTGYNEVDSIYDLKQMDCIVQADYHVLLFDCFDGTTSSSTAKMYIYDSSTNLGKVARRLVNVSDYQTSGWLYRSPWITCTYTAGYNSANHYKVCSDCGHQINVEAHTYVAFGLKYRCTGCGYITSNPAGTTSFEEAHQDG